MNDIRLIALDLDGTLLDDDKAIPPENIVALREADAAGVRVAISTGRMVPRIEPIQDALGIDCILLSYNGGKVVGTRAEGRPQIRHCPVPADIAALFLAYSREHDRLLNFFHEDTLYAEDAPSRRRFSDLYSRRTGAEYHFCDLSRFAGVEPTKMILFCDPPECEELRTRFRAELEGRAYVTISEPEYLEIMAPNVNKGEALRELAAHYGYSMDEVIALGDSDNDAPLLEAAGVAVCMANGRDSTKALADHVTERTNNEAGVAEAVRKWVLGEEGS